MVHCMEIHIGIASLNTFISCTKLGCATARNHSHYVKIYDNQNGTKIHGNSSQK